MPPTPCAWLPSLWAFWGCLHDGHLPGSNPAADNTDTQRNSPAVTAHSTGVLPHWHFPGPLKQPPRVHLVSRAEAACLSPPGVLEVRAGLKAHVFNWLSGSGFPLLPVMIIPRESTSVSTGGTPIPSSPLHWLPAEKGPLPAAFPAFPTFLPLRPLQFTSPGEPPTPQVANTKGMPCPHHPQGDPTAQRRGLVRNPSSQSSTVRGKKPSCDF